jgi:hypothetical protein
MFTSNPQLIKLAEKAFVLKNFASAEECSAIVEEVLTNNKEWSNTENYEDGQTEVVPYLQVINGSSKVLELYDRLKKFTSPEFEPLPSNSVNRLLPGQSLQPHCDSPGEDFAEEVIAFDPYDTCHIVKWGTVTYLSEFTGGEIYYPNIGVSYKPEVGDLLIHSAFEEYTHGVRPVLDGVRYVYSTFLISTGQVPLHNLDELRTN